MSRSPGVLVEVIPLGAFGDFVMDGDRPTVAIAWNNASRGFQPRERFPTTQQYHKRGRSSRDRSSARMVMQACYHRKVPLFSGCPDGS
ncbi:MAG: hypothetical protein ACRC8Y_21715 [Chroococcales cyanobacterium]